MRIRGKLEHALLWFATVAMGFIVIDLMNREPIELGTALLAGLIVGVFNFAFSFVREAIQKKKERKMIDAVHSKSESK